MSISAVPSRGSCEQDGTRGNGAVRGSRPMIAWLQTDLPEPNSPTSASVPPGGMRKGDVVDGPQDALVDAELDGQIVDPQQILHTVSS